MNEVKMSDGFQRGTTKDTTQCARCGGNIPPYCACYYGGKRVGNVTICKNCGEEGERLEDEAKYGERL